jgi:amylosucrase
MTEFDFDYEAERSLKRIWPKCEERIRRIDSREADPELLCETLLRRMHEHWYRFFFLLHTLYGKHYDFFFYLESITLTAVEAWLERPQSLKTLDLKRESDPQWYQSERLVGGSVYVDLFAGDLKGLREKIPYLRDLGIRYLHLMPLFATRPGNSDGGYAISDYRTVDPRLGTIDELRALADELRAVNISLVLDFVFNHTADDHEWALRAQEGEREFMDYYHIYPDRSIPDQYERHLREIFPSVRRGNFFYHTGMQQWIWTTFNSFQWDLKYSNPEVFRAMASEMLYLANSGVEVLRLDAVAFIWKKIGTQCENLPEAHWLIQAYNALCRIAAPGLVFKSEAIVHPDEVARYISPNECHLSYNPTLMALLWESLATRETRLLKQSLSHRHQLPESTSWVNYLRGHDDIGWSFDDEDAWQVGINPAHHRDFLNRFYTARFEGSFARGIPFQHNTDTGDMRISGTMASLAGLEDALARNDKALIDLAIARMRMLYGVLCSIGGLPLLFLGDEWGMLNDYSFENNPDKVDDSRWVHRPQMDWSAIDSISQSQQPRARVFRHIQEIIFKRKELAAFGNGNLRLLPCENKHVLAYLRWRDAHSVVVFANFSEHTLEVNVRYLRAQGIARFLRDSLSGDEFSTRDTLVLPPYAIYWLEES